MTYSPTRRVWDVPTRLFHWLTVLLLALSWWTAENHDLEFHRYSGFALLGLLCFRLYWGFVGSTTARFSHFIRGPSRNWSYVRKLFACERHAAAPGHNPLGAWSVVILLLLLGAQIGLGLFAVDVDGIESGPLSAFVSFDAGRRCAELHETTFNTLLVFIALHVLAMLFYWIVPRRNLIASMIHGKARTDEIVDEPLMFASLGRAAIGVLLAAAVVWLVARVG
ncbi:MAG: cytochrome b/b6 domain-containing protein [Steroidobacteraceae bacterium]